MAIAELLVAAICGFALLLGPHIISRVFETINEDALKLNQPKRKASDGYRN
jgi:hypothetical protein